MRTLLLSLLLIPLIGWSQNSTVFQVWNEAGVGYKINKKQSLGFDLSTRHDANGLQTVFPQVSYKYKLSKLIRPSIDYRYIGRVTDEGNFTFQHRINANLQLNYKIERFQLGLKGRYQFTTSRIAENFEPEFDEAFRVKPSVSYDIKKSILIPTASLEFFTGPMNGQQGYHLNRLRWRAGIAFEWDGPHSFELAYQYDQRINSPGALNRAILNLSYSYSIKNNNSKKKDSKQRNTKFL